MEQAMEKRLIARLAARELTSEERKEVAGGAVCYVEPDGSGSTYCPTHINGNYDEWADLGPG